MNGLSVSSLTDYPTKPKASALHPAFAKTIEFLAKTPNQAAVPALLPGLDAIYRDVHVGALQAILERRDPVGQKAVFDRIDRHRPGWDQLLEQKHGRLGQALRDALVSKDPAACKRACQTVVRYREYDLMLVLVAVAEAVDDETSEQAAAAILELAQSLYKDLSGPRDYSDRRDPQFVRRIVVNHLEKSAERFPKHQTQEIVESFLLLANRDNAVLQTVLYDPHHPCYLPIVDALANATDVGIIRLLLDFLDNNQTPAVVLSTIADRRDRDFVRRLIARWRDHVTPAMRNNVKRIESFAWADPEGGLLKQLDEPDQIAVLSLLIACGFSRSQALSIVRFYLESGARQARHAAMRALEDFSGPEADSLVTKALRDEDPEIVAMAVHQARARNLPGVISRLAGLAESPHAVVRQAVRENLTEFHFDNYWAGFELMEPDVRTATGELVRRVDPEYLERLSEALSSPKRNRRMKAAAVASAMNVAQLFEAQLVELMEDDDELVREEVANALGGCKSQAARRALEKAQEDRFPAVREAASASLTRMQSRGAEVNPTLLGADSLLGDSSLSSDQQVS